MESTNLSKWNHVWSYDTKVARLGQGVDIKFSQGSGTSTESVKITIVLHLHSPVFRGQNDSLCYALLKSTDIQ